MAQTRVGTLQVKDGDIQTVDIADLAVITSKVADKAVTLAKMADCLLHLFFIEKLRLQVFLKCRHWLLLKQILV
jgi:hypothetical protein